MWTPRTSRRARPLAVSALAMSLLLTGCSSDEQPRPSAVASADQTVAQQTPTAATTGAVTVTSTSVVLGDPDAPERVVVYSDLSCPHCKVLHGLMADDIDRWAAGSDVAVELVTVDYLSPRTTHEFSLLGANLLALVAEDSPEAWPAVQAALYDLQPGSTTDAALSVEDLVAVAEDAGATLEDDAADRLAQLAYSGWVESVTGSAAAAGVTSIPQVFVDGAQVSGESHEETAALVRAAVGG